jgi:hypothetical protein
VRSNRLRVCFDELGGRVGSFACEVSRHCYGLVIIAKKIHGFQPYKEIKYARAGDTTDLFQCPDIVDNHDNPWLW